MNDSTERHETNEPTTERFSAAPAGAGQSTAGQSTAGPIPAAQRPPARMSTVVWGLIIVVVGAGVLARALGAEFDNELALIVLLCTAGAALVVTSTVSAVRRR